MAERPQSLHDNRVLAYLAGGAVVVAFALAIAFAPEAEDTQSPSFSLTTYSSQPFNARGLYLTLERLGWEVERHDSPFTGELDTTAVYAVLAPPLDLTTSEVKQLLAAVRAGAGLVLVLGGDTHLADSLRITASSFGTRPIIWPEEADALSEVDDDEYRELEPDSPDPDSLQRAVVQEMLQLSRSVCDRRVFNHPWGTVWLMQGITFTGPRPPPDTVFLSVHGFRGTGPLREARVEPAAIGFQEGRGRVVVVSDPALFANDVIRLCEHRTGVVAVQMFEWVSGRSRVGDAEAGTIVFGEYHHGAGRHPSIARAVWQVLTGTEPGRALAQILVALFVLLLAVSIRPVKPLARTRMERRSPLEHVGALARAYEQVGASRTATRRLIGGLRRRHAWSTAWRRSRLDDPDLAYLSILDERFPVLRDDVQLVREAATRPVGPARFLAVGRAIENIERTISK